MKFEKVKKLTFASLFGALVCVASSVIQIPSPSTGGFFNLGDCFVITASFVLPCGYAAFGAGTGSALADIITGHAIYAPASFVIKALMAICSGLMYSRIKKKIPSAIAAEVIMCAGYFLYEAFVLKFGLGASGSLIANAVQGVIGAVISVILGTALEKTKIIKDLK